MNINIEDYLSDDEIKQIVKEEFRNKVQENLRRNGVTTWIANLGYQNVLEIINTEIPEYESLVKEKTKEAIEGLTSYSVFRKKGLIDDEDSLGQKYLEFVEEIKEKKLFTEDEEEFLKSMIKWYNISTIEFTGTEIFLRENGRIVCNPDYPENMKFENIKKYKYYTLKELGLEV